MSNQRERDLFEKAYRKIQMIDNGNCGDTFEKYPDGRYVRHSLGMSWLMWQASANREGYKLVPVEPTEKMVDAGMDDVEHEINDWTVVLEIYKAMIGAAE